MRNVTNINDKKESLKPNPPNKQYITEIELITTNKDLKITDFRYKETLKLVKLLIKYNLNPKLTKAITKATQ